MTALYSVNLHVMGKSNLPLLSETTLATRAEHIGARLLGRRPTSTSFGWEVGARDASMLVLASSRSSSSLGAVLYRVLPHQPRHGDAGDRRQRSR